VTLTSKRPARHRRILGGTRIGVEATTKINRKDFGLVWNATLETGGFMVGEKSPSRSTSSSSTITRRHAQKRVLAGVWAIRRRSNGRF